jgi:hypothetical protein
MAVEVNCAACGGKFRVPDTAAGKRIKCPKCKAPIDVPAAEGWTLKTEDGAEYGPVTRADLDAWLAEGRITAECQLLQTGAAQWQWASDLYPELSASSQSAQTVAINFKSDQTVTGLTIDKETKSGIATKDKKKSAKGTKSGQGSPAITYLAYASYAICGLQVLAGILIIVMSASLAAAFSAGGNGREAKAAAHSVAVFFFSAGVMSVIMSLPALLSGYGLMHRQQWGRILTIVLAALSLPSIPIGTAYGIWAFIVLFDKKYADEFK